MNSEYAQNGYLTSNRLIRFPFADDSSVDGMPPERELLVFGCFVDAAITATTDEAAESLTSDPPVVHSMSSDGVTLRFTLAVAGHTYDLSCARSASVPFPVLKASYEWGSYVLVLSSVGISELGTLEASSSGMSCGDIRLGFSPRCLHRPPVTLRKIKVYGGIDNYMYTMQDILSGGVEANEAHCLSGDVTILPGNNFLLTGHVADPNRIALNAIPGAGDGIVVCECSSPEEIGTPGLQCEDGHVRLFNDKGYDLVPDTRTGTIQMHAKATACCTCEMYADVVNDRLLPISEIVRDARTRISEILAEYEKYVQEWNRRISTCRPEDVVMVMSGTPLDAEATDLRPTPLIEAGSVAGMMDRCGVSVTITNNSYVSVEIRRMSVRGNGKLVQTVMNYTTEDGEPVVRNVVGVAGGGDVIHQGHANEYVTLYPGRSLVFTFVIVKQKWVSTDFQTGFMARADAEIYLDGDLVTTLAKKFSL